MTKNSNQTSRTASARDREQLYRMQAELCRVLGHPKRLHILDLLADGEKSNAELLRTLKIGKVNLSQHLAVMRFAGLVESRQEGREAFHRLAFSEIKDACRMTREVLAQRLSQTSQLARSLGSPGRESQAGAAETRE